MGFSNKKNSKQNLRSGGIFDFNRDGKTNFFELNLGLKMLEGFRRKNYEWRNDDTIQTLYSMDPDISPYDFENETDYLDTVIKVSEAKARYYDSLSKDEDDTEFQWPELPPDYFETKPNFDNINSCGDNTDISLNLSMKCAVPENNVKLEDYPNKRRYNAACTLANYSFIYKSDNFENEETACCKFILDNADKILAANYLSYNEGFLYAQAIKDNFDIPCCLPDEDEAPEMKFFDIIYKIVKRNISLSLEIWAWCLEHFLPYEKYDRFCKYNLTSDVFYKIHRLPDEFKTKLIHYMSKNATFCKSLIMTGVEYSDSIAELIVEAIKEQLVDTANILFHYQLKKANNKWKVINTFIEDIISCCKNYEELESIEYFRDNFLPSVKKISIGMVQDEVDGWKEEIAEYIDYVESNCEKYAYTRKNAWRKSVPNGNEYDLDPCYYESKQEYLNALNDAKYGWREWYKDDDNYGLNSYDFETQEEYQSALNNKINEELRKRREKSIKDQEKRHKEQQILLKAKRQEYSNDKTIYTYCGVLLPFANYPYSYRTEDETIKIGDTVVVPVGKDGNEMNGEVVSVGQYSRLGVPYPVEKTKMIIKKIED